MPDERLKKILHVFEGKKGALISIFQRVQEEYGYLPEDALNEIARFLKIPTSQVYSVATFYAHFYLKRRGDHVVRICQGTACHIRGAANLMETTEYHLGIKTGETTEDYRYTLERVACMGSCALGPIMMVDDDMHVQMTTKRVADIFIDDKEDKSDDTTEQHIKDQDT